MIKNITIKSLKDVKNVCNYLSLPNLVEAVLADCIKFHKAHKEVELLPLDFVEGMAGRFDFVVEQIVVDQREVPVGRLGHLLVVALGIEELDFGVEVCGIGAHFELYGTEVEEVQIDDVAGFVRPAVAGNWS